MYPFQSFVSPSSGFVQNSKILPIVAPSIPKVKVRSILLYSFSSSERYLYPQIGFNQPNIFGRLKSTIQAYFEKGACAAA